SYDPRGDLTGMTDSRGAPTTYVYDLNDRVYSISTASSTPSGGADTIWSLYDTLGNLSNTIDANGNTTTYLYDNDNRATTIQAPLGRNTAISYNEQGRVTGV